MHYHGHRERLRKRLTENARSLADYEMLELLLGYVLLRRDTKPLAKDLLEHFGTISSVMAATPDELSRIQGIGPGVEALWTLLQELAARTAETPLRERLVLSSPEAVAAMARQRLGHLAHEEIWVAFLDNQNKLIEWERISKGSLNASVVHPRDILERALLLKASGFIMVHNHPGGTTTPSGADIELTRRIHRAADTMHIRMVDHLIVTSTQCYSLMAENML